jgi:hypothetical protein
MALGQAIFRDNRRRRVLQEEAKRGGQCAPPPVQEGARYTEAAGVENHPQITQFVPRRYRSYAFGLLLAAAAIGLIELLHVWADEMARSIGSGPIAAFDLAAGGGLASWLAAVVLVAVAVVAWMIFTLRRHRVNDYKARYRLWLWVCVGAVLASANSVARLHEPWSGLWINLTGWSGLGGAIWWLAPVGLVGVWLAVRLIMETAECRGACALVAVCSIAYLTAALASLRALPAALAPVEAIVVSSAVLAGHAFALAAVMLYARYVVFDVQGLIEHAAKEPQDAKPNTAEPRSKNGGATATGNENNRHAPATLPIDAHARQKRRERAHENDDAWVDGSEPDDGGYDDDERSRPKLSKADRKRLRKERRQCA